METTKEQIEIKRKVDELGRIVIPKNIRNELGIVEKDFLEILKINNKIILKKTRERKTIQNLDRIRAIDELGRIVLPIMIRKDLGIKEDDILTISIFENSIELEKI